jgi:hypothetical protein
MKISELPKPKQPEQVQQPEPEKQQINSGIGIHHLATVVLFFMFLFTFAWSWHLFTNADARAIAFQTNYANNTNHVYAEIASLTTSVGSLKHSVSLLEDRTGKLEKDSANLSDINRKLDRIDLSVAYLATALQINITSLQAELAVANRQIITLLQAQNGSSSAQGNGSSLTPSPYLLRYQNLTCYHELRQTFGQYLDPEWLCNAGQQMPEYSGWVEQACACAREAGLPY